MERACKWPVCRIESQHWLASTASLVLHAVAPIRKQRLLAKNPKTFRRGNSSILPGNMPIHDVSLKMLLFTAWSVWHRSGPLSVRFLSNDCCSGASLCSCWEWNPTWPSMDWELYPRSYRVIQLCQWLVLEFACDADSLPPSLVTTPLLHGENLTWTMQATHPIVSGYLFGLHSPCRTSFECSIYIRL